MKPETAEAHSAFRSLVLHLLPGFVALLAYLFLCLPISAALGFPKKMGFVLMDAFVLIPLLLGSLLYAGHKKSGRWTFDGAVLYRRRLPGKQITLVLLALTVWGAIVMALTSWTDAFLLKPVFYWVPGSLLDIDAMDTAAYPLGVLIGTRVAGVAFVGLLGPIAEEFYFRGYLLPRISWMGSWAAVWQAVLFSAYHLWSLWSFIWRVFILIPAIYLVQRKRSMSIGIWGHCIGNTAGELLALAALVMSK